MILNPLTILLLLNGILTIGLILNQNQSTKTITNTTNTSLTNGLENITWFCVILEFLIFLIKSKFSEF